MQPVFDVVLPACVSHIMANEQMTELALKSQSLIYLMSIGCVRYPDRQTTVSINTQCVVCVYAITIMRQLRLTVSSLHSPRSSVQNQKDQRQRACVTGFKSGDQQPVHVLVGWAGRVDRVGWRGRERCDLRILTPASPHQLSQPLSEPVSRMLTMPTPQIALSNASSTPKCPAIIIFFFTLMLKCLVMASRLKNKVLRII